MATEALTTKYLLLQTTVLNHRFAFKNILMLILNVCYKLLDSKYLRPSHKGQD